MDYETFEKLIKNNQSLTCSNWDSAKYLFLDNQLSIYDRNNKIIETVDYDIYYKMNGWKIYDPLFEYKKLVDLKIGNILQSYPKD
jgi:hypothetical protein